MYLRDGVAEISVRAATLRHKLQIKLAMLPSCIILALGQPVLTPTL